MYEPTEPGHLQAYNPYNIPPPPPPENPLVTQLLQKIEMLDKQIDDLATIVAALTVVVEELREIKKRP